MHRLGAFSASLVNCYEGDVTETVPSVVGVNADGSAIAGKAGITKKADRANGNCFDPVRLHGLPLAASTLGKAIATHTLNRPEIASRVADQVSEGANDTKAWASQLDGALRESMRAGGRQNLLEKGSAFIKFISSIGVGLLADSVQEALTSDYRWSAIDLGIYALYQLEPQIYQVMIKKCYSLHLPRRWSLFPYGMQPDRYVALNGLTRVPGLIRAQK